MIHFTFFGALAFVVDKVNGHSWVECTKYDIDKEINDNSYSESDCSGWIREWRSYGPDDFGEDHGADFEVTYTNYMCEKSIGDPTNGYSDTYDDEYPPATYTVGETIRLLWPAKNHANYECSAWQLDHGMRLFVNTNPNPTSDLGRDTDDWTLVIDWHEGYTFETSCTDYDCSVISYLGIDGVPYQNCPHFCDNTDLAVCYGDFTVPDIFPEDGYYTFVWYWEMKLIEIYTSCFEVYIDGTNSDSTITTVSPSSKPTIEPSNRPTTNPSNPTSNPTDKPTESGEDVTPVTDNPTQSPTPVPTQMVMAPTVQSDGSDNDDDDGTDNNNDNEDDDGSDDNNNNNDTPSQSYMITIPVCITDAQYNEDTLINSLKNYFSISEMSSNEYDIYDYIEETESNEFNATLQVWTYYPIGIILSVINGSVCHSIENEYKNNEGLTNVNCDSCDEYAIHTSDVTLSATNNNSNNNDDTTQWLIYLIIILVGVIILMVLCAIIYCCCMNKNESGKTVLSPKANKEMNEFGLANVISTNGNNINVPNIVRVESHDPPTKPGYKEYNSNSPPTKHTNGPRPPPPRPPRRY